MARQDVGELVDALGFGRFNWTVMFIIGMIWLMEGVEITLISLVAPRLKCEWNVSNYNTAVMTSAVFAGMGIGAVLWGWFSDNCGRKRIIFFSSVCVLFFSLLTASATNFTLFVVIRFLVGISVGGIGCAICYLVEFSTTPHRARVVIATQFFFAFGNLFAAMVSYFSMNTLGWKVFVILCATPIPFTIILIPWLPESVRFLQNTGSVDKIINVLQRISKLNGVELPDCVKVDCIVSLDRGNIKALLNKSNLKNLTFLIILWTMALWSYYGLVLLNTNILQSGIYFQNHPNKTEIICRQLDDSDYLQNIIVVLGEFPGLIFFIVAIEVLGRKRSLILSFFATSICFSVLTLPLSYRVMTIVMFLARATSGTITQILYVITTEMFPTTIRNTALGCCFVLARLFLAGLPFLVNILLDRFYVGLVAYLSAATFLCCFLCLSLPETTGKNLTNT